MSLITKEDVINAIRQFLSDRLNDPTRLPKEERTLERLKESGDDAKIEAQMEKIANLKEQHEFEIWIENAATRLTQQLKFGTHISKGIHSASKGDNINLNMIDIKPLPKGYVGSQSLKHLEVDASGSASALPLAAFFLCEVVEGVSIRDLLQTNHSALKGAFSENPIKSDEYQALFEAALNNQIGSPETSELNKQILWPFQDGINSIHQDQYLNLVPLYPISLANQLYFKVREQYSDENRENRKNRYKKTALKKSYHSHVDLAVVKLGGANAQNVSQLNKRQNGVNYLIPSIPPQIGEQKGYRPRKGNRSLFSDSLSRYFLCKEGLSLMVRAIKSQQNRVGIRSMREEGFDLIIAGIFSIARNLQKEPGWSEFSSLAEEERFWLDPAFKALLIEEGRASQFEDEDAWLDLIERRFANWLSEALKKQVGVEKAREFDDTEVREWRLNFREAVNASRRRSEEAFK